jgi:RimJ/RimL family protein N-acetyltransferase
MLPQLHTLGYGNYALIRKSDQQQLGICGLYNRPGLEGIDLGFGLLPQYEKQGYAFEAAQTLLTAAFEVFNIPEVKAITVKENTGSRNLLEKLGLQLKETTTLPNDTQELLVYEILKCPR